LRSRDVNLIESVESGFHPYDQARKLEAITAQVQLYQQRIVVTTYSPYIMAHLDNLLQGSDDHDIRAKQAKHLFRKNISSFISHEQVEVYETKKGIDGAYKLEAIPYSKEDKTFHWDTLSDPSVDIQQIFFKIYKAERTI
jgi:hypothetical protein